MFAASPPPHTRRLSSLHLLTASRSPGGRRHRRCPAAMSLDFGDDDDDEEGEDDSATAEAAADAVASSSVRPVDSEMDSSVVQVFGDNGDDDYGVDEKFFDPPASDLGGGQRHCPISPIHLSSGGDASASKQKVQISSALVEASSGHRGGSGSDQRRSLPVAEADSMQYRQQVGTQQQQQQSPKVQPRQHPPHSAGAAGVRHSIATATVGNSTMSADVQLVLSQLIEKEAKRARFVVFEAACDLLDQAKTIDSLREERQMMRSNFNVVRRVASIDHLDNPRHRRVASQELLSRRGLFADGVQACRAACTACWRDMLEAAEGLHRRRVEELVQTVTSPTEASGT
uniref:TFIIS central domain-containing protein n=1 Tax=Macrostomum lignano TaxID=282301 RepID=A0A1I8FJF6_9PLAT